MPKKKSQRDHDNPLSQARRLAGGTSTCNKPRGDDSAAREIWFRKSGQGYHCFVEYYAEILLSSIRMQKQQRERTKGGPPPAEAAAAVWNQDDADSNNDKKRRNAIHQHDHRTQQQQPQQYQGAGWSRAAKRRRKKKGNQPKRTGNDEGTSRTIITTTTNATADSNDHAVVLDDDLISKQQHHPLLDAAKEYLCRNQNQDELPVDFLAFFEVMARPLPLTFRIRHNADPELVQNMQSELSEATSDSSFCVREVLPTLRAYQADCAKVHLSQEVKDILFSYSQNGVLARQELGSMLPVPALLSSSSSSLPKGAKNTSNKAKSACWLDICASPGSKTLQLLEHWNNTDTKSSSRAGLLLIANDISQSRLDALRQAVERSGVANTDRITYNRQDASKLELLQATTAATRELPNKKTTLLKFDAIVCDVPCSGDGTCRKDRHIMVNWNPAVAHRLHQLQLDILSRAMELLKPGGTVCYSTCSMNPIENEAVVAAALEKFNSPRKDNDDKGSFDLDVVEWAGIAGLILREGLTDWKVADCDYDADDDNDDDDDDDIASRRGRRLTWYDSYDEAVSKAPGAWARSMWPPAEASGARERLSRCRRLWPQDQDSGGFFLALIRKI